MYRNLGRVDKWGIDGSVAYEPIRELTLYVFGSSLQSEIKDDLIIGDCTAAQVAALRQYPDCTTRRQSRCFAPTRPGSTNPASPKYTFGGSARSARSAVFELGVTGKRTGPRYVFDTNVPTFARLDRQSGGGSTSSRAKTPAYTLVNLDARLS